MNSRSVLSVLGVALVFSVVLIPGARAEIINLKASLSSSQQVPPNDSKGAGTLLASYDTVIKRFSYVVNYAGLTGPATAAHFHGPAVLGQNAAIIVPVQGSLANPIRSGATLTDAQAANLMAGKWYFNIHTAANKGGEIRGQVTR